MTGRGRVVVVGLGPGGADLLPPIASEAIARIPHRWLRTTRHPAAAAVPEARSFDARYDRATRIEDVYAGIVDDLVAEAATHGEVLYAVPGSPAVAEHTVELLLADARVEVDVLPSLSFLDLAWVRLGVDPVASGVRVVDGHRFEHEAAGERGPLLVAQCDSPLVLGDVKLALSEAIDRGGSPDVPVTVLQRLGLPDEHIEVLAWHELDRVRPDHLTSLWLPRLDAPVAGSVQRFVELVATLRAECPWDREQTHGSLRRHLLEETYEVLEAIDGLDPATGEGFDHLEEELGDLLFQVVFHATLASEAGQFTLADVATTVHDKLRDRHPHVFGDDEVGTSEALTVTWEQAKRAEKGRDSVFDGVPAALPALLLGLKVLKKGASLEGDPSVGSMPPVADVVAAADGLVRAVAATTDVGDAASAGQEVDVAVGEVLLSVVQAARAAGVDPEAALRQRATAWRDAARDVEQRAR